MGSQAEFTPLYGVIATFITLPPGFPEKYRTAIERAVDHCTVKKHILEPPRFELNVSIPRQRPAD